MARVSPLWLDICEHNGVLGLSVSNRTTALVISPRFPKSPGVRVLAVTANAMYLPSGLKDTCQVLFVRPAAISGWNLFVSWYIWYSMLLLVIRSRLYTTLKIAMRSLAGWKATSSRRHCSYRSRLISTSSSCRSWSRTSLGVPQRSHMYTRAVMLWAILCVL